MIFSIFLSFLLILLIIKNNVSLGGKLGILDIPNKDKIHKDPIPLLGGPIILLVILIFLILQINHKNIHSFQILYITSFFMLGFLDDRINLDSSYKIIFVIFFSLILIWIDESFLIHKIFFEISNNSYFFGKLKIPITLFCILLLYIAMNMSDGINCLLISFSIFALLIINILIFNSDLDLLDLSILFSLVVLFYLNYKNILFLGNSGASLLSAYFIYNLISTNYYNQIDVFEIISIFLIMGLDMVRLVIIRIIKGQNPFVRDLNHFHHLLLKKFTLFSTIIFYLILSFSPIIISQIMNITTLFIIPCSLIIYFFTISKLS